LECANDALQHRLLYSLLKEKNSQDTVPQTTLKHLTANGTVF
jgi:hypothetical protein